MKDWSPPLMLSALSATLVLGIMADVAWITFKDRLYERKLRRAQKEVK